MLQQQQPPPPRASSPPPAKHLSPEEQAAATAEAMAQAASELPLDLTLNPNYPTLFSAAAASKMAAEAPFPGGGSAEAGVRAPVSGHPARSADRAVAMISRSSDSLAEGSHVLLDRQRDMEDRIARLEARVLPPGGPSGPADIGRGDLRAVQEELKRVAVSDVTQPPTFVRP